MSGNILTAGSRTLSLRGKVVVITGSSTGIGAAIAVKFASAGAAAITIHGRQHEALESVKRACVEAGAKVRIVVGDLKHEVVRNQLINETITIFGSFDVLVNNAGIFDPSTFPNSSLELYDNIFDINVRAVIGVTKMAAPHLVTSKGNIVNISAALTLKPQPWAIYYSASKAALDNFGKSLALELGPQGVRVNTICPSYIKGTEISTRTGTPASTIQRAQDHAASTYPLRRAGTVEDVANAALFLASDSASFITGIVMPVDGGYHLS